MIFYFTATGNSLYAARSLDTDIYSIPQEIHRQSGEIIANKIGIVCPIFGHEIPSIVKTFLTKFTFKTDYFFVILTYGNIHGGAAELAREYLSSIDKKADYINTLLMTDNYLPAFDMNEQIALESSKKIEDNIASIKSDICSKREFIQPASQPDKEWHEKYLARQNKLPKDFYSNIFRVTENCIGCGICANICPVGSIRLENQHAIHTSVNCQMCLSCVHSCPKLALQLNISEKNPNARFRNSHVRLTDIVTANNQNNYICGKEDVV